MQINSPTIHPFLNADYFLVETREINEPLQEEPEKIIIKVPKSRFYRHKLHEALQKGEATVQEFESFLKSVNYREIIPFVKGMKDPSNFKQALLSLPAEKKSRVAASIVESYLDDPESPPEAGQFLALMHDQVEFSAFALLLPLDRLLHEESFFRIFFKDDFQIILTDFFGKALESRRFKKQLIKAVELLEDKVSALALKMIFNTSHPVGGYLFNYASLEGMRSLAAKFDCLSLVECLAESSIPFAKFFPQMSYEGSTPWVKFNWIVLLYGETAYDYFILLKREEILQILPGLSDEIIIGMVVSASQNVLLEKNPLVFFLLDYIKQLNPNLFLNEQQKLESKESLDGYETLFFYSLGPALLKKRVH